MAVRDLNASGQVLMQAQFNILNGPFLWQNGAMVNIFDLVELRDLPLHLSGIMPDINNQGQIVANASLQLEVNINESVSILLSPIGQTLGDVNLDCKVDEFDIIAVLKDWGPNKTGHLTDIVSSATFAPPGDGKVDGADLAVVLGNWSPGPPITSRSR